MINCYKNNIPTEGLRIKTLVVSMVYDDHIMMLVQITLQSSFGVVSYKAFVAHFICCPPKPITLCILLGEHQQYLQCKQNRTFKFKTLMIIITSLINYYLFKKFNTPMIHFSRNEINVLLIWFISIL